MNNSNRTMLSISELFLSPENMRKAKTSKKSDQELKASIKSLHLIQNLVVSQKTDNGYPVEAGGRRYTQCLKLVEEGHFNSDEKLPVMILAEGQSAKDVSLVENIMREKAHVVDEFEAFLFLHEQDNFSIADIATRYKQTQKYIKQRLLLGAVAPELREDCRQGLFSAEILEAFTISDDHEQQLAAYNAFKDDEYRFNGKNIRLYLTEQSLDSTNKLVRFIGLSAYKKSGGHTISDLFEDTIYLNDKALFDTLLDSKMKEITLKLEEKWAWVEVKYQMQSWEPAQFYSIAKEFKKVPEKLVSEIAQKKTRYEDLDEMPYDDSWDEKFKNEYDALSEEIETLEEKLEGYKVFVNKEIPFGGCIVTVDSEGKEVVYDGLVRDADINRLEEFRNPKVEGDDTELNSDVNEGVNNTPLYNDALKQDISAYRKSIAKVATANNSNLGSDMAMFSLCYPTFSKAWGQYPLNTQIKDSAEDSSQNDISDSKAQKELDEILVNLDRSWVGDDKLASLIAFRALPSKTKKDLCAYCAAYSLCGFSLGQDDAALANYVFAETNVEVADYYRPSKSNFFKRVKEPHFTELGNEILGAEWMEENNTQIRSYIAEKMEKAVLGDAPAGSKVSQAELLKWMPKGF